MPMEQWKAYKVRKARVKVEMSILKLLLVFFRPNTEKVMDQKKMRNVMKYSRKTGRKSASTTKNISEEKFPIQWA